MSLPIGWAYIAGFFDGEGCLHAAGEGKGGSHKFSITIAQADDIGYRVLHEIKEFLQSQNINAYVVQHSRSITKRNPKWKPCWNLWVRQQRSVRLFIDGVLPYLRVKKQRAEDYRRLCILSMNALGCTHDTQIKLRRNTLDRLWREGRNGMEIARIVGVDVSTVYQKMKRLGYKTQTALAKERASMQP
jgi:hypothetical protein